MRKNWLVLTICIVVFLSGCGQVTRHTTDIADTSPTSESQEPGSGQDVDIVSFSTALQKYAALIGPESTAPETVVSTEPFVRKTASYSLLAVSDSYAYWKYETKVRTVNGQSETINNQYRYFDKNGNPFNYNYDPKTATESFSYIERYQDIYGTTYAAHYHEKITFNGTIATITMFPGDTFTSTIVQYSPAQTLTVTSRTISFNSSNGSGSGTLGIATNNLSGNLNLTIANGVFSGTAQLKINNKAAVQMTVQNDNQVSLTYLLGKNTQQYYYTEFSALPTNMADPINLQLTDSGTYTSALSLSNHTNINISAASGAAPVISRTAGTGLTLTNCQNVTVNGLAFQVSGTSTGLAIESGQKVSVLNCTFTGNSQKTATGLLVKWCESEINVSQASFSWLKYGMHVVWGGTSGPLDSCGATMSNNTTNVYRGGL